MGPWDTLIPLVSIPTCPDPNALLSARERELVFTGLESVGKILSFHHFKPAVVPTAPQKSDSYHRIILPDD